MASILKNVLTQGAPALWEHGGWVMYPLYGLGLIAWILVFAKLWDLILWNRVLKRYKQGLELKGQDLFSRASRDLIKHNQGHGHPHVIQWEWEIQIQAFLNRNLDTIGRVASVTPLIGLLGTVSGLIATFEVLYQNTLVNATQLSQGISEALVATQSGLLTAFPLMLAHQQIFSWAERLEKRTRAIWTHHCNKVSHEADK